MSLLWELAVSASGLLDGGSATGTAGDFWCPWLPAITQGRACSTRRQFRLGFEEHPAVCEQLLPTVQLLRGCVGKRPGPTTAKKVVSATLTWANARSHLGYVIHITKASLSEEVNVSSVQQTTRHDLGVVLRKGARLVFGRLGASAKSRSSSFEHD